MVIETVKKRRVSLVAELSYLPNLITLGRIASIPVILVFIDNYSPERSFIATMIYMGASITDFLDGWLARRRKQVSLLGKFLDPLADKLIVTAVLVYLAAIDRCPSWLVVVLLSREFAITGLRSIATTEGLVISASDSGKQKTALQLVATLFLLTHFRYPIWGTPHWINFHQVGIVILYMAMVMSIFSGVHYFLLFYRAAAERDRAAASESNLDVS